MKKGPAPIKKVTDKVDSNGPSSPELLCRAGVVGQVTGFTLIELLVTLSIIAVILSVALPITYNTYKGYQESLDAEKVLVFLSSMRRESFLHGKEKFIETKDGNLIIDGEEKKFKGIYIHTEKPLIFYKNGTTSGGKLELGLENNAFLINVQGPTGDLKLIRE